MRTVSSVNRGWRYTAEFREAWCAPGAPIESWQPVDLPHANKELPYNGFDEKSYQFVSCYARDLSTNGDAAGPGKRVFLDFAGVMAACDVWMNGARVGGHVGGYTPFSIELTGLLGTGGANRLVVRVDSTERADVPPFGHVIDYLCYGGIYREVLLRVQEDTFIADVFARPRWEPDAPWSLALDVEVDVGRGLPLSTANGLSLRCVLRDGSRVVGSTEAPLPGPSKTCTLLLEGLEGLRSWELDSPALHDVTVELLRDGAVLDGVTKRVGFRRAEFTPDGFFLNGRRTQLVGLNRHQSFPYVGYAMPARAQRRDALILKEELGVNIVRTSHYPQATQFLDACDELGLLVFEELPGWQHIGNDEWKANARLAVDEMIRRDRSHASVVLWGVRINESKDDHDFYLDTGTLARRLDPTRQTAGVRDFAGSELLEDVYTFNDFSHAGGSHVLKRPRDVTRTRRAVPYLVTEYNGHMFPTKRFDNEERLMEHALRHLRVLDTAAGMPGLAGVIGWCAFDYNTHKDFGSGDRICYHGVSDMFRIPKYAAAVYASQRPFETGPVLEAASIFAKGERQAARLLPIYVFTNCDDIVLFRGGERLGVYQPAFKEYPHVSHPPVIVRELVGDRLPAAQFGPRDRAIIRRLLAQVLTKGFEAFTWLEKLQFGLLLVRHRMSMSDAEALVGRYGIGWGSKDESFELVGRRNGKEVVRRRYGADAHADRLSIAADDPELSAGDWDATRVVVKLEDQYGNIFPFAPEVIDLSVSGPATAMGPSRLALIGGCAAFWVRSKGEPGAIEVRVRGSRLDAGALTIMVH